MIPVVHSVCGTQVGWFLLDAPTPSNIARSGEFVDMDGVHPTPTSRIRIRCPVCGIVTSGRELRREFKE